MLHRLEALVLLLLVVLIAGGSFLHRRPAAGARKVVFPSAQQCEQSRAGLVIAIDAYRARFAATAQPSVSDLLRQRLISTRPAEYLFAYTGAPTPRFFAVSGSHCAEHP